MTSPVVTLSEIYKRVRIVKENVDTQSSLDLHREFSLVKLAMDKDLFKTKVVYIKIKRGPHKVTDNKADKPHLTMTVAPGLMIARLYLSPEDTEDVTDQTDTSHITMVKSDSYELWQTYLICAEATTNNLAHTIANTDAASDIAHARKAARIRSDRLWPNGTTITYSFIIINQNENEKYRRQRQSKVSAVLKEWEKYANITFMLAEENTNGMIRIAFDEWQGSYAYTGKENLDIDDGLPTVNFNWPFDLDPEISAEDRGCILHGFGHVLGLIHEHQSPLQGNKLVLKEEGVIKFYTEAQGWYEDDIKNHILSVYNGSGITNYSKFDTASIMNYFYAPMMSERGLRFWPRHELSAMDKAFMAINYPSNDRSQFSNALDTASVTPKHRGAMLQAYDKQNWSEIRYAFALLCAEARLPPRPNEPPTHPEKPHGPGNSVEPEGDALFCLAQEDSPASPNGARRGLSTSMDYMWDPKDVITFCFIPGSSEESEVTEYRKSRIRDTFNFYANRANLSFQEIEHGKPAAKIRISFGPRIGAKKVGWSKIGCESIGYKHTDDARRKKGGTADTSMYFSDVVPKAAPVDSKAKRGEMRTLYHEFGHALGLRHEHTSPFSPVDNPQVDPMGWIATTFDEDSVMLYPKIPLSPTGHKPKFTKVNYKPSKTDLAFLGVLYPYPNGDPKDRLLEDLEDLGISETQVYLDLRSKAFGHFPGQKFRNKITAIRNKLQKDLRALALRKAQGGHKQRSVINPNATPTTGSFLEELMKQLSAFFRPTSGQLFALQFPGRFLQQDLYAWDTNQAGIYGQFVKPTVVNESEFRLVDQLYNVGTVIGAPSGLNLSIVYEQVLNNLVPGIQQSQINFSNQQAEIRRWLTKDVPTSGWVEDLISSQHTRAAGTSGTNPRGSAAHGVNPAASSLPSDTIARPQFSVANKLTEGKVNRMELAAALMQEYLSAKQAWELQRDKMIKDAKGKDMDALTRELAHITAIREEQLASKHADAVVRGYSHAIRQYLGYMDIMSPAEALQDAKDSLRESAESSLDGSMKIYPVQLQPIDWFQSLSTSFTMEDLTANPDLILQQIDSKSKQLDALNSRLAVLQGKPKVDIKDLQSKLDDAQDAYDRANADLTSSYATNVISLAKACVNGKNVFVMTDFLSSAKSAGIANVGFNNLEQGMKKLTDASSTVQKTSRTLTQLMAAKSLAEATDTTQEITETTVLITALTKDISELTARLQSLRYKDDGTTAAPVEDDSTIKLDEVPLLIPDTSTGGSRWQDFSFSHEVNTKYSSSTNKSGASTRNTSIPLFFGSYQSGASSSTGTEEEVEESKGVRVEVGFRATLVTVDRGGWFQPQFFKQSASFHSIDPNVSWSKWPDSVKTVQDLSGIGAMSAVDAEAACNELNEHLLPAYPSGFVICKDITIKIHLQETDIQKSSSEMESYAATSAGVLCFSTSASDSSKESNKDYGFKAVADGCVIRIPGPQILGYVLQFTDPDTTSLIPDTLPEGFLISDDVYNSTIKPDHGIKQPTDDKTQAKDKGKLTSTCLL